MPIGRLLLLRVSKIKMCTTVTLASIFGISHFRLCCAPRCTFPRRQCRRYEVAMWHDRNWRMLPMFLTSLENIANCLSPQTLTLWSRGSCGHYSRRRFLGRRLGKVRNPARCRGLIHSWFNLFSPRQIIRLSEIFSSKTDFISSLWTRPLASSSIPALPP